MTAPTLLQILPFTSLGTKMVSINLSNSSQLSTNCWCTEKAFVALLEELQKYRETPPEKHFIFNLTDDGVRQE